MNVYILFEKADQADIERIKRHAAAGIRRMMQAVLETDDITLQIYAVRNLECDVKIILNQYPRAAELLRRISENIPDLIADYIDADKIRSIRTVVNPDFKPVYYNPGNSLKKPAPKKEQSSTEPSEFDYEKKAELYTASDPAYTFDRVILSQTVLNKLEESLNIIRYEQKVFKEWGLYAIQPHPSSALSFYGPSGTGKTMAAEAIADKLGKKILKVSYADIESKFHGEGPKMVKAIFLAAQRDDAVLFIDEADSLLSKRLTNVTQGSEQAINSMRSQLLICLEQFNGIVIFATNLVVNYDQAFLTRLISIQFSMPDEAAREKIWEVHIRPVNGNSVNIPLAEDVDVRELARMFPFCGREIRKAVISACVRAAMEERDTVSQADFIAAGNTLLEEENQLSADRQAPNSIKKAPAKVQEALIQKLCADTESEGRQESGKIP